MQPGTNPEDINAILNRFHSWADKHPAKGNGNGSSNGAGLDEVREFPYEEAIREYRDRRATRTPHSKAAPPVKDAVPGQQKPTAKAAPSPGPEVAPSPEPHRPFISSLELLAALNNVAPAAPLQDAPKPAAHPIAKPAVQDASKAAAEHAFQPAAQPTPKAAAQPTAKPALQDAPQNQAQQNKVQPAVEAGAQTAIAKPLPRKRPAVAKTATARAPKLKPAAAFRQILSEAVAQSAEATVPVAPPKPARKALAHSPHAKTATQQKTTAAARVQAANAKKAAAIAKPHNKFAPMGIRSALLRPQTAVAARSIARNPAPGKSAAPSAAKLRPPKPAPFRQSMAGRAPQPKAEGVPKKKPAPDRTRRITTRFSPAEERRIEKQAADLGLNVSAYLRHCALGAAAGPSPAAAQYSPAPTPLTQTPGRRRKSTAQTLPNFNDSAPAPSFIGGWLALLRNRFLGPPARLSEDA
jgi:hypothetical protein